MIQRDQFVREDGVMATEVRHDAGGEAERPQITLLTQSRTS